jgi:site-specific recombinase XerD
MNLIRRSQPQALAIPSHNRPLVRRIFDASNIPQTLARFESYLLYKNFSKHTRTKYLFVVRQFLEFLGDKPFTAATKPDYLAYFEMLSNKGLRAQSIQNFHYALRAFSKSLRLSGQIPVSIPHSVLIRKAPKRLPHAKSIEEIESLIAAAGSLRNAALLELGYAAGLRVSELSALRCEDVELKARSLTVRDGKGGKDRIALFGRKAAAAIEHYLAGRKHGPVFVAQPRKQRGGVFRNHSGVWYGQWRETDRKGNRVMRNVRLGDYELPTKERARLALDAYLADKLPAQSSAIPEKGLSTKAIWRIVTQAANRAGLTGVHPHTLRHSFASHLLNAGADLRSIQELLGHETVVTTQKYLHIAQAPLIATHAKFHPREAM